jgi:hypothetical protein
MEPHFVAIPESQIMSDAVIHLAPPLDAAPPINPRNLLWVAAAVLALIVVITIDNVWLLNFVHVMSGVLWTGIDLFMGFVIGPILGRVAPPARRAIVLRLMPKMLFLMPTLALLTGTAGYYHAKQIGLLDTPWPQFGWVVAALVLIAILTVQGLGLLLPTNLRVYLELRRPQPDIARIKRLTRSYVRLVAFQGILQVCMIVVMAKFVTGL